MARSHTNKRGVETFIVNKAAVTTLLHDVATTENLVVGASMNTDLIDGRIGITVNEPVQSSYYLNATMGNFTDRPIRFVQGTADSQNLSQAWQNTTYPLTPQAFIESTEINPIDRVRVRTREYVAPTNTVWVVGDTGAVASGAIVPNSNTEYAFTIAYRGRTIDEVFSPEATAFYTPTYTTPDYTALGTVSPLDHLVQNLVWVTNRSSVIIGQRYEGNEPVVAIALDLTGTAGTDVSALTTGFLPLVNTSFGLRGITVDTNMLATLQAALPSGSSIVTVDLTTAGAAANTQAIAFVALDRKLSYVDEVPTVKIDIDLGLRYGFDSNTVQIGQTSFPNEGQGLARQLDLLYKATHGQRRYDLDHEMIPVIKYPSPIVEGTNYHVMTIESISTSNVDTFNNIQSPKRTFVCVPVANEVAIWDALIVDFAAWATPNGFGTAIDWAA